ATPATATTSTARSSATCWRSTRPWSSRPATSSTTATASTSGRPSTTSPARCGGRCPTTRRAATMTPRPSRTTSTACPSPPLSATKLYYSFGRGTLHFVAIDTEEPVTPESPQGQWLEADLAQAQAAGRWILPFFHKAIFSIGRHAAQPDVAALRPILHALFQK